MPMDYSLAAATFNAKGYGHKSGEGEITVYTSDHQWLGYVNRNFHEDYCLYFSSPMYAWIACQHITAMESEHALKLILIGG